MIIDPASFKTTPYAHQAAELIAHCGDRSRALFWDMGTGKTKIGIDTTAAHVRAGTIRSAVVIAPQGVEANWLKDELPTHMASDIEYEAVQFRSKKASTKWHQNELQRLYASRAPLRVLAIAYDAFRTEAGRQAVWDLLTTGPTILHVDESGNVKTPKAIITKTIQKAAPYFALSRIYSGTPIDKSPFDIYSQVSIVDPKFWQRELDIPDFFTFQHFFGIWDKGIRRGGQDRPDREYPVIVAYQNLGILRDLLKKVSSRVILEDVVDLPEASYTKRYYEMEPEQRDLYEKLEEEYMADWPGNPDDLLTAELTITRLLRLQQILCGYVPFDDDDPKDPRLIVSPDRMPRLNAFSQFVEDIGDEPLVTWAVYDKDIDLIIDRLLEMGRRPVRYDGMVSPELRERAKAAFKAGDASDFVSKAQVGGEGITLINGHISAFYNNSYRFSKRKQAEKRIRRIGQSKAQLYADFVCEGTRDEAAIRILQKKHKTSQHVLGDVPTEWL